MLPTRRRRSSARLCPPYERRSASSFHQRTASFRKGTKGFFGRNRGKQLERVPFAFRLRRLLHLVQIHGMDLAAIHSNCALTEKWILSRQLLHFGDDGLSIACIVERYDRPEIMGGRGINACLHVVRHHLAGMSLLIAAGKLPGGVIHVPVEWRRGKYALGRALA